MGNRQQKKRGEDLHSLFFSFLFFFMSFSFVAFLLVHSCEIHNDRGIGWLILFSSSSFLGLKQ